MVILPGYTFTELLNESDSTCVYRATRIHDQKKVIIKTLNEAPSTEALTRFHRSYQLQNSLRGMGVATILDYITYNQTAAIIMEDDGSVTLQHYLHEHGSLELTIFFTIALPLTRIIENIHSHHIIHKDINPRNILWNNKTREVKIIDFDIASILLKEEPEMQNLHKLEGTLDYISPEQTGRMNRAVDYRSDFYSLGVTFYEMLTGKLPFIEKDILELVHAHLAKIPESVSTINPKIPPNISDIVAKLMAKIPEERYGSAAGLRNDLLECSRQWQKNKNITSFLLGQKDIRDQIFFSQKIYGRENEINQLLNMFSAVSEGANSLLFIAGYSGIGKTSLIKEIYKPVTRKSGYFIKGKYDQLQRSTPYSGFSEAFKELVRYLLTEPENELLILRDELLHVLGHNGQVIVNLIPNIELIIGPQPAIPDLTPAAAHRRFMETFQNFMEVIAQKKHPLVLFLDDLQWADIASLELIKNLLSNASLKYFFLIGAYRDNEVLPDHPLAFMQEQLIKADITFKKITLVPLKPQNVNSLIADSLNMSADVVAPLSDTIFNKTQGNPFFINEFLRKLHHEKLLYFSYREYIWRWDLDKIREEQITANVVDLVIARIYRLPHTAQRLLKYAACIGHTFDIEILSIISQTPLLTVAKEMTLATQAAFISPLNKNYQLLELAENLPAISQKIQYRFQHDRIQQAAYQLIGAGKKEELHLKIGRLLLQSLPHEKWADHLFEIITHLNKSINLITDTNEKLQLAKFNLLMGKKAKGSGAYTLGQDYLQIGLSLLANNSSKEAKILYFELFKESIVCYHLTGDYQKSEQGFHQIIQEASGALSLVQVYKLQCQMLGDRNESLESLKIGNKALKLLGIKMSLNPSKLKILWLILKIEASIFFKSSRLQMKPLTSERFRLITEFVGQMMLSSFATNNQALFMYLICLNVYISLTQGYNKTSAASGVTYAYFLLRAFKAKNKALKISAFFLQAEEHYGMATSKARLGFVNGSLLDPWQHSLEYCLEELRVAQQFAKAEGDFFIYYGTSVSIQMLGYMAGTPIPELQKHFNIVERYLRKIQAVPIIIIYGDLIGMINKCYRDPTTNILITVDKMLTTLKEIDFKLPSGGAYLIMGECVKILFLFNYYKEACALAIQFHPHIKQFFGDVMHVNLLTYPSLAFLTEPPTRQTNKIIQSNLKQIQRYAQWMPENFLFHAWLLQAELAKNNKTPFKAMQFFKKAIDVAEKKRNLFNIGLAYLCGANFYQKYGFQDIAKLYLTQAHYAFNHWGALRLCSHLEKTYPQWLGKLSQNILKLRKTTTTDESASSLDVISILRSTQLISSEIELDNLLQKLIVVLLQNAGAQRGVLLMKDNETWYVGVEGTLAAQHVLLAKKRSLDDVTDLPMTLIRFVQRTQEIVLIQSQEEFATIAADAYITEIKPQSLIILPILYQGQLTTILYLENRAVSHAFTQEHIHILKVLSSQAIISLQNARLYYQATHDPLTGLANRNLLYQMFPMAVGRAKRNNTSISILFLDLDGFKKINDTLGHEVGDELLIYFANRIKTCIREGDLAVRLGGDEFVAILEDTDTVQTSMIAERILNISTPPIIQGHNVPVKTSIGISTYPSHGDNIQTLLKHADLALYRVKEKGKGHYQFYTAHLDEQVLQENRLEKELHEAIERNELCIYYQPVYTAKDHTISHFEALLRWQHPTLGLLESKAFIHYAEADEFILTLGAWVFKTVIQQIKAWQKEGVKSIPVAINVSALQLKKEGFNDFLIQLLKEYNLDPYYIELEITESIFIDHDERISKLLHSFKNLGIALTLDDFGSHYSSLAYLRRFPVTQIKIDQTFVRDIEQDKKDKELVQSMIIMAHKLNLKVVAEGVETKYQMDFLEECGADKLQGYYLGRPMNAEKAKVLHGMLETKG